MVKWRYGRVAAGILSLAMAGCSGGAENTAGSGAQSGAPTPGSMSKGAAGETQLTGAGSSFDNPLFTRAFYDYHAAHSGVTVNYQSVGSGAGIKSFSAGLVDFGATDVPMNAKELSAAESKGGSVVQLPVALGAAALAYNIEGAPEGLKLTPKAIAGIFLGSVKKWNDPAIASANQGMKLPAQDIAVVHRADGSGTTYIFSDYLATVSPEWNTRCGRAKEINWPVGVGAKGTEGVAGGIAKTPGAIGYVELAYVLQTKMKAAAVQNVAGKFVMPSLDAAKSAAAQFPEVSPTKFSIVNAKGDTSYPICGYSWVLLYQKAKDPARGKALADVIKWVVSDAQKSIAPQLGYAPLPDNTQKAAVAALDKMAAA